MHHRRPRWVDVSFAVLLCLLSLAFYRHIALSNRILAGTDAFTYFYPYRAHAAEQICSGQVPLWNPWLFMGVPFFANPQAAVFYPFNVALCWLSTPKIVAWSAVLHTALAGMLSYLYGRVSLRLSPVPALLGASVFALGGYLSAQIEHINQVNVLAWFPLLLLLWDLRASTPWPALAGLGLTVGVGLLAGHTQASYISLAGLFLYALLPPLLDLVCALRHVSARRSALLGALRHTANTVLQLLAACMLGLALAAVQLLPSLELSGLSIRGGGLSYREAVAFSLKPLPHLLRYTFLPPWGANLDAIFGGSYYTEYLAYLGTVPLLLIAAWLGLSVFRVLRGELALRSRETWTSKSALTAYLAALGVLLALGLYNPLYAVLYKIVPGFGLFRVPARWLFFYAFGGAMLAGIATQRLGEWVSLPSRPWVLTIAQLGLVVVALAGLFAASSTLAFNHPTAPEAFTSLRTAPSHVLAAQRQTPAPGRLLSMSDMLFDPGDLAQMHSIWGGQLGPQAMYDYVVSAKRKEIVAPNLSLLWHIHGVDGYDGGLLPLDRYIQLQHLFLSEEDILPDGRLRERLRRVPPSRLLSILGVEHVLTDKVHDVWIDDVFYDLAFDAALSTRVPAGTVSIATRDPPGFVANGLGLVSYLEGARDVAQDTPVAEVRLFLEGGEVLSFALRAGHDTAEGLHDDAVGHAQARIGHTWRDQPAGSDYIATLEWDPPGRVERIEVAALPFGGQVHVRGLSLIDSRDGSSLPVILSTDGQFRQVHSGDVKVYQVLDTLPRAYVVHRTRIVPDDEAALQAMAQPGFDPSQEAILAAGNALTEVPGTPSQARVVAYAPEQVTVEVHAQAPGYLVLSDAWYPGWRALLDGQEVPIERANLHFRAIYLLPGTHTVEFTYRPTGYRVGAVVSITAVIASIATIVILVALPRRSRRAPGPRREPDPATNQGH